MPSWSTCSTSQGTINLFVAPDTEQESEYDPTVSGYIPTHVRRHLQPISISN